MSVSASAIQVMKLFGVDEALIGDLHEQRARSTFWQWQQAGGAILVAICADFRIHWILAARAVFVGMVLWTIALPLAFGVWRFLGGPFASVATMMGFTHPGIHATTVAMMALGLPAMLGIGWAIARLHRTRTPMPVIAFLIVVLVGWIPQYSRQVSNAIGDPRFRPYLFTQTLSIVVFSLSVLAGGLWKASRAHAHKPDRQLQRVVQD
jgi:hypothetical protein